MITNEENNRSFISYLLVATLLALPMRFKSVKNQN